MTGDQVRSKLLTYCSTRFPDFKIYGNDTFSGFRFRDLGGERHVLILFFKEENGETAIVNLGLAEYHYNLPMDKLLDKLFVHIEFKKFEEWSNKWEITISKKSIGVRPEHSLSNRK